MNFDFIGNDTIALLFIGSGLILGIVLRDTTVTATAIGAIGGYIGGSNKNKPIT